MKHKTKIILDRNLRTDWNSDIYKQGQIILVTSEDYCVDEYPQNFEVMLCPEKDGKLDLNYILKELYTSGIKSIFVEAGGKLCGEFVKENLVDKIYHFIAPKILNDNSGKSCFDGDNIFKINDSKNFKLIDTKKLDSDILLTYKTK